MLAERRREIDRKFAERHPDKVRAERELRRENREVARAEADRRGPRFAEATVQTLRRAARSSQGSLARMYHAGAIDADQLAAAHSVRQVHERIGRDVRVGSMSMETRVDQSRSGDGTFFERLGAVRAEVAYTRWRGGIDRPALVLAMVVEDCSCRNAARRHHVRDATARRVLAEALDYWCVVARAIAKEISQRDLALVHAGLL